jgi:hypothetical protein
MIKLEANKMAKAVERAKAIHPRVKMIGERRFLVWRRERHVESAYTVRFVVANGNKLAECNCKAGQAEMLCYHVAAAAQVNVMMQSMRRQGASASSTTLHAPAPRITRQIESSHNGVKVMAVYCDGWAV